MNGKREHKANWKIVLLGVVLLAVVLTIMFKFAELEQILGLLKKVNYWWILAAFALQLGDYAMDTLFYRMISRVSYWHLFKATMAMSFLDNTVPTFSAGGNTLLYYSVRKKGSSQGKAAFMIALNAFVNFVLYFAIFVCGMAFLVVSGKIAGFGLTWIFAIFMIVVFIALYRALWTAAGRRQFKMFVSSALRRWPNARKKALQLLERLYYRRGKTKKSTICLSFLFIATSYILRISAVFCVFLALGYTLHPGVLMIGYFLTSFISVLSYVRMGVQEAAMSVSYSKLGVPYNLALTATLLYRLVTFWAIILIGFFAFRSIINNNEKEK